MLSLTAHCHLPPLLPYQNSDCTNNNFAKIFEICLLKCKTKNIHFCNSMSQKRRNARKTFFCQSQKLFQKMPIWKTQRKFSECWFINNNKYLYAKRKTNWPLFPHNLMILLKLVLKSTSPPSPFSILVLKG